MLEHQTLEDEVAAPVLPRLNSDLPVALCVYFVQCPPKEYD